MTLLQGAPSCICSMHIRYAASNPSGPISTILQRHWAKSQSYVCDQCQERFASPITLRIHKRDMHTDRTYRCCLCRLHESRDATETPLQALCPYCQAGGQFRFEQVIQQVLFQQQQQGFQQPILHLIAAWSPKHLVRTPYNVIADGTSPRMTSATIGTSTYGGLTGLRAKPIL